MLRTPEPISEELQPRVVTAQQQDDLYALPATAGQERFWALDQLNPGNPALNMPLMWQCTGPLNASALAAAFTACVQRHESLRTTFTHTGSINDGSLAQIIHAPCPVALPVVDLEDLEGDAQRAEANRLTRAHAALRFDLARGPLLLVKLLRFDAEHHLLLVTMHHIICDGISLGILLRDLAEFYRALTTHSDPQLPALPVQFADYALWLEQWLASDERERSLSFWRDALGSQFERAQLARDPDALDALPPEHREWTGEIETLQIPLHLQHRANAFCKRANVTLNILLFSVFATLLHRLTGQYDLTIGSPCANRTEDTEELIGLFMNIQVLRLRLDPDERFTSLLRKVQDWTLGAYEHQTLPFESLVHDPFYGVGTSSFELPIFFLYQKSFMLTQQVGGVEIVPLRSESPGAVFEIFFAIVDRPEDGPRLQLEYNPRSFKASTIRRYLRMFVQLLEAALDAPEERVGSLELLGPEGRAELTASNRTDVDLGAFEPVTSTFLRLAEAEPDRIAVECDGATWTNAQLAGSARQLAERLLARGLQTGDRVGIAVARSPQMVASLLAVLLAGGVYVPLDARHPRERLEDVLRDSETRFLLVSEDLKLSTSAEILFATTTDTISSTVELPPAPAANDLAYVIYTSGTTGGPKGVAIEHGALVNLLRSIERTPGLDRNDVLVAITTLAFDIATLELLLPLLTGARLVIATEVERQDARQLLSLLDRSRATVLQATPGVWRLLLDAGWQAPAAGKPWLKALCGGEALPRELAQRILPNASQLWNMYGPTETTIWSSATRVTPGIGAPRIGPPIANTQFYVLNPQLQPAPCNVTGELYIGGAGLARGYWNRPELTTQRFIANPFGPGRLYATGDLARQFEDGSIEVLGRADFQVKIRGNRIELGEIEEKLLSHAAVKDAVVTPQRSDSTGVTRLTAYVAAGAAVERLTETLPNELRTLLESRLPDYMLPTSYVVLHELPRNTNGKIDRNALPQPNADNSGFHSGAGSELFVPPSDIIEAQLQDIWQTTLGIPHISIRASFFSLGVGSLAALRLTTKMNRIFAMDLGLASLISASTIESIAELIRKRIAPNRESSLVPLQPHGALPPLYIVHGVGGNVVNFFGLSMRMGKDQPVYGIQSQALVAKQPALLHLKDMAGHYIADMRKLQPSGPYHLLGYSFGGTVVLEMAKQLKAAGEEVAFIGMIDSKSKDYEETVARLKSVHTKVNQRLDRFRGNTGRLKWKERYKYVWEKVSTRTLRYLCWIAAELSFDRVPAFMRSAYDINYIAIQKYRLRPYDGHLILFRASEQAETGGPYDLGWGDIFERGVQIFDLPGDHERIFLEPNIEKLASCLRDCLAGVHA